MGQKTHYEFRETFGSLDKALQQSSYLGIGAHPDDLEVMAGHGILHCLENKDDHFFGVTCTNGAGSSKAGDYKNLTVDELIELRRQEQVQSYQRGKYSGVAMLDFSSQDIKSHLNDNLLDQLQQLIEKVHPKVVYTHNPFDKHLTHVAVMAHVIEAFRRLSFQPEHFFGCEVWRGLDWLDDNDKQILAIDNADIIADLISLHRSQTESGKDYAQATKGRMAANATFFDAQQVDQNQHQLFAVDLLPFLQNPGLSYFDFAKQKIDQFHKQVKLNLTPFCKLGRS